MKYIPFLSLALAAAVTFVACVNSSQTTVSEEDWIEQTLAKMSVEQKVKVIHAQSKFSSAGVPELGIPSCGAPTARTESVPKCFGMNGFRRDGPATPASRSPR